MGVGIGGVVALGVDPSGHGHTATGAIARCRDGSGVARPDEPILFVITEVLGIGPTRTRLTADSAIGRAHTEHIASLNHSRVCC